jgi:ATPase subunit of ABC transporter with duplicated ATPase domains
MISVRGLKKSFGDQILYDGADLQLNAGDRYALVGPNGAGKSTLFKMLLGEEELEAGR